MDHSVTDREIVARIREVVPDVLVIYRFGSAGTDTAHAESDLDLAVLFAAPFSAQDRWNLEQDLSIALHRDVDLVDLRTASTVMRKEVVSTGNVLFESEPTARHRFEMCTYSSYALLNEERAAILEDIRARGRAYGR